MLIVCGAYVPMGTSQATQALSAPKGYALTFVLRSTHSSQLSVGLLRFCFFLGGASPPVALVDASGLVEGCVLSSSAFMLQHGRQPYPRELGPSVISL